MRSPILIAAFILISIPVQAKDMLSSWEVRQIISTNQTKHYHRDTGTFEKKKAITELNDYLTTTSFALSDFDKVQFHTAMARIETTQAGCKNDYDAATVYMKKALKIADGRISSNALWCSRNISNIKRLSNKKEAYSGETCHLLFREALRKCTDEEIRKMMMMPVGEKLNVEKMVKNEMSVFKDRPSSIAHAAKSDFNKDINSVADAYWFLLWLRGDIDTEDEAVPKNESANK